jgi:hypothetical protein
MRRIACTAFVLVALVSAGSVRAGSGESDEHAEQIRSEVQRSGGAFAITEASSTGVVESLTLLSPQAAGVRVVPAAGGVYYALCPRRARCPYPARGGARLRARVPRALALELARRTFERTTANLVVVSLPSRRPALLVLERGDVTGTLDHVTLAHVYALRSLVPVSVATDTLVLARIPLD